VPVAAPSPGRSPHPSTARIHSRPGAPIDDESERVYQPCLALGKPFRWQTRLIFQWAKFSEPVPTRQPQRCQGAHPHMRADPVRQRLRECRLGIGIAGGAEHADEDLGVAHKWPASPRNGGRRRRQRCCRRYRLRANCGPHGPSAWGTRRASGGCRLFPTARPLRSEGVSTGAAPR
jgi:hypothetical protein